ncbi:hypothetical protein DFR54_11819 [Vagococcus fluvialis]|uniref:Uncharacterized protein n=1 Tax=Vagococcus fluvialis TaxID=2738 RepID=A0A369AQB3_9ENTE|nr:hypothetical protein [Vagococcus fluvialis]RCX10397.1 hypothetical protein DFR54_11819 [Vagococcus fluvialis]RST98645.1 hypothetical protein CBF32_12650 [Vagococcus fluvialis]
MTDETLQDVINDVDAFKKKSIEQVRKNIDYEIETYKQDIPKELNTSEFDLTVQKEVDAKLAKFNDEMDIKPTALYYSLKTEAELNEEITEKELTMSAYDFLEKHTNNKILKKILKELKKETKNG